MINVCPRCGSFAYLGLREVECYNRVCVLNLRFGNLGEHDRDAVRKLAKTVTKLRQQDAIRNTELIIRLEKHINRILDNRPPTWEYSIR